MQYVVRFRTPLDEALAWLAHESKIALKPPRSEWHATLIPTFDAPEEFSLRDFVGGIAEVAAHIPCYQLVLDSIKKHKEGERDTHVISIGSTYNETNEWYKAAIALCTEKLPTAMPNPYDLHVSLKDGMSDFDARNTLHELKQHFEPVRVFVRSCRILCRARRSEDWQSIGAFDLRG